MSREKKALERLTLHIYGSSYRFLPLLPRSRNPSQPAVTVHRTWVFSGARRRLRGPREKCVNIINFPVRGRQGDEMQPNDHIYISEV
jgi:hypothetical protein